MVACPGTRKGGSPPFVATPGVVAAAAEGLSVASRNPFWPPGVPGACADLDLLQELAHVDDVVVLGGAIDTHVSFDRSTVAVADAGERITAAAELSRRYPDARIILSGGASHLLFDKAETESALTRDLLVRIGVPESRVELEERSRNTCENAVESRGIAAPKPGELWLLVTSASHMPRAIACFRAAAFPIIAYPVDYRTLESDPWRPSSSIAHGLEAADLAAHE